MRHHSSANPAPTKSSLNAIESAPHRRTTGSPIASSRLTRLRVPVAKLLEPAQDVSRLTTTSDLTINAN